jgi:hypothetical protein
MSGGLFVCIRELMVVVVVGGVTRVTNYVRTFPLPSAARIMAHIVTSNAVT